MVAALGKSPKYTRWVLDRAPIGAGSNIIFSVERSPVPPVKIANMRDVKPDMKKNERRLNGIGKSVDTLGTMEAFFHFRDREYSVTSKIIPGNTLFIISHKYLNYMGLNYETYHKIIKRLEDGYSEPAEMRSYLPFWYSQSTAF